MANDSVRVSNMPDSGSAERVAFDLLGKVMYAENRDDADRAHILDLYAECLYAARGFRKTAAT